MVFALRLHMDWALILKLGFVVFLLGQDASHRRLYALVAGGVVLYLGLSGRLAGLLAWAARAAPSPGRLAAAIAPGGWVPDVGAGGEGAPGAAVAGRPGTARMLGVCAYALVYGLVCSLVPAWRADEIRGVPEWWLTLGQRRTEGGDAPAAAEGGDAPAAAEGGDGVQAAPAHAHID